MQTNDSSRRTDDSKLPRPSGRSRRATASSPPWLIALSVGALALSALLIGGCGGGNGGDSADPGVASIGSSSTTGNSSQGPPVGGGIPSEGERGTGTPLDEALAYAKCLRANGLPKYPDPEERHGGLFINVPLPNTGSGLSLHAPQVLAADRACARQRGAVFGPPSEDELEELRQRALNFAECMRAHGIEEWPDPVIDSNGVEAAPPEKLFHLPGAAADVKACDDASPSSS